MLTVVRGPEDLGDVCPIPLTSNPGAQTREDIAMASEFPREGGRRRKVCLVVVGESDFVRRRNLSQMQRKRGQLDEQLLVALPRSSPWVRLVTSFYECIAPPCPIDILPVRVLDSSRGLEPLEARARAARPQAA